MHLVTTSVMNEHCRIGQREKWNCDAVVEKVSVDPSVRLEL